MMPDDDPDPVDRARGIDLVTPAYPATARR